MAALLGNLLGTVDGLLGTDVSGVVDEPVQGVTGLFGGLLGH